jgi:hypothetical protein
VGTERLEIGTDRHRAVGGNDKRAGGSDRAIENDILRRGQCGLVKTGNQQNCAEGGAKQRHRDLLSRRIARINMGHHHFIVVNLALPKITGENNKRDNRRLLSVASKQMKQES